MSAKRNVAVKIDGQSCMSHFLVVSDVMPVRALPVLRYKAICDVWSLVFF